MKISNRLFEDAARRLPSESPTSVGDVKDELDAAQIAFETLMIDVSGGRTIRHRDETRSRLRAAIASVDEYRSRVSKKKKLKEFKADIQEALNALADEDLDPDLVDADMRRMEAKAAADREAIREALKEAKQFIADTGDHDDALITALTAALALLGEG